LGFENANYKKGLKINCPSLHTNGNKEI